MNVPVLSQSGSHSGTRSETRISDLRRAMALAGLDGYLVAHTDEHLGAMVPQSAERLAWLSGFSGSAGLALVLVDRAAIFSDGRYMLQLGVETDPAVWDPYHQFETPPSAWLDELGRSGLRIGYDPRVTSAALLATVRGAWGSPVAVDIPLLDPLWTDRPRPPDGPVLVHPDTLSGRSSADKRAEIAAILRADGQDGVVLADPTQIAWLLNLRGTDLPYTPVTLCHALLLADATVTLFLAPERVPSAVLAALGPEVDVVSPSGMQDRLAALSGLTIRLDTARTPIWFWQILRASGVQVVEALDPCLLPRARKNPVELAGMRAANDEDGVALCRLLHWLETQGIGRTESEVAEMLLGFRMQGPTCRGASFETIAAVGSNAALMHYHPDRDNSSRLRPDSLLLLDSGGQYPGGTTDVTRTVWLGDAPPPAVLRRQFTAVLKAHVALASAIFPDGTVGHRLDVLARGPLWQLGLDFDHGAGHGLGSFLSVHEWPLAFTARPSIEPIHAGMVLTNEPGFYQPGSHGIRLENAMQVLDADVGDQGRFLRFETLSLAPFDRQAIALPLLSQAEIDWIDAYHADVVVRLMPALDDTMQAWLSHACRPLRS